MPSKPRKAFHPLLIVDPVCLGSGLRQERTETGVFRPEAAATAEVPSIPARHLPGPPKIVRSSQDLDQHKHYASRSVGLHLEKPEVPQSQLKPDERWSVIPEAIWMHLYQRLLEGTASVPL